MEYIYAPLGRNVVARAKPGCSPFFETVGDGITHHSCNGFMNEALSEVMSSAAIKTVVLSSYGVVNIRGANWLNGVSSPSRNILNNAVTYKEAMRLTLARLVGARKQVIFVVDVPDFNFDPEVCVPTRPVYFPRHIFKSPCAISRELFEKRTSEYHRVIEEVRSEFSGVKFIDAWKYFCDDNHCSAMIGGQLMYRDNNHLNVVGAHYFAREVASVFEANGNTPK
jgi:hypothetical protein